MFTNNGGNSLVMSRDLSGTPFSNQLSRQGNEQLPCFQLNFQTLVDYVLTEAQLSIFPTAWFSNTKQKRNIKNHNPHTYHSQMLSESASIYRPEYPPPESPSHILSRVYILLLGFVAAEQH